MEKLTGWYRNSGKYGVLRSLALEGPQSVAQIARARPVARQGVQRLADQLAREGLIEYVENPAHQRAKLARLTPHGEELLRRLDAEVMKLGKRVARSLSPGDISAALRVVTTLRDGFSTSRMQRLVPLRLGRQRRAKSRS